MVEVPDSEKVYSADLVLIALGFLGPEKSLAKHFGVKLVGTYLILVKLHW